MTSPIDPTSCSHDWKPVAGWHAHYRCALCTALGKRKLAGGVMVQPTRAARARHAEGDHPQLTAEPKQIPAWPPVLFD